MRAAAALAVVLLMACSDNDTTEPTIVEREAPAGGHVVPSTSDLRADLGGNVEVLDITDFRDYEIPHSLGLELPVGPCGMGPGELQRYVNKNLQCGVCYALICDGSVYAHVCGDQCEVTVDPDGARVMPRSPH